MKQPVYDIVALVSNDLVTDRRMHRCLQALTAAGYRCLLLGRERPASKPIDTSLPFYQQRHRLSSDSGKLFYYQLNRAHYQELLRLRPKAILVVDLDTMWAGARAAQKLSVPWVYDAHELFVEVPEVRNRPLIQRAWSWLAKRYIPRAAAAYTVGEDIAAAHTERYGRPFGVVRNVPPLLPISQRTSVTKALRFTIIYQGAINAGRGLEQLIDAAAQLPDCDIWIVGDGYLLPALRKRAQEHGSANITFYGERAPSELPALTAQAHLGYALMENVGLNYYLSLSNKSLDYVHAGLPSLQMDWPEYRRLDAQFGCYEVVGDLTIESLLAAIKSARGEHRYEFMQVGCRAAAQQLNWQVEQQQLLHYWRDVLLPSTPPPVRA